MSSWTLPDDEFATIRDEHRRGLAQWRRSNPPPAPKPAANAFNFIENRAFHLGEAPDAANGDPRERFWVIYPTARVLDGMTGAVMTYAALRTYLPARAWARWNSGAKGVVLESLLNFARDGRLAMPKPGFVIPSGPPT